MALSSVAGAAQNATQANTGVVTPTPLGIPKDLPNAGIYMQQQAQAELAWQQAQTQLLAQRNTQYHSYGLGAEGQVDPFNQYGRYQSLLSQHEAALHQAEEGAQQRGLFGPGLGMQGERALRYVQGQEDLGLQQDVAGIGQQYDLGIQQALASRNRDVLGAQLSALAGGGISGYGAGGIGGAGGGSGVPLERANTVNGYSDEEVYNAALQYASGRSYNGAAYVPHMVMQEGQITVRNGVPGVMVKFMTADGVGGTTEWVPLPPRSTSNSSSSNTSQSASKPAQSPAVQAAIAKLAAAPLRSRPGME